MRFTSAERPWRSAGAVEADLRRQVAEQLARSENLAREVHECRAALEERKGLEADLRRQLGEQLARSEGLAREVHECRAALEERNSVEADLRRQVAEHTRPL